MSHLIELNNLTFGYTNHLILDKVSFSVEEGDYLGIIGPNGSGKTTLLKIVLGLLQPRTGTVTLLGSSPKELAERWKIGYVPQRITQADWQFPATVSEVIKTGRTASRGLLSFYRTEDSQAVERAMKITGITKLRDRLINELSGGERQKVFIARALAGQPKVLILDEPTVGVDLGAQQEFYTLLCKLNSEENLTIILVSHDIDVVAQEVKTILFLNKTVVAHGKPKDLLKEKYLEKLYGSQVKFIVHNH